MDQRQIIAAVARRLPQHRQRDVAEVLACFGQVWAEQLARGETVSIPQVGTLYIEVRAFHAGGVLQAHGQRRRVTGRLRLSPRLKAQVRDA